MMAMREICCTNEGDQGLNEGDSSKSQKGVLQLLSEGPFILMDNSIQIDTISMD